MSSLVLSPNQNSQISPPKGAVLKTVNRLLAAFLLKVNTLATTKTITELAKTHMHVAQQKTSLWIFLNNNFDDFNLTAVEKCSNFSPERAVEAQVEDGVEEAVEDAPVQAP